MDELNTFLKQQQNLYQQNNTYDINICSNISNNISNFNIDEQKFYSIIKKYRKYKLNYSQGKIYQDLNNILGGVRSTCTYIGASNLKDLNKCTTFVRVNRQVNNYYK